MSDRRFLSSQRFVELVSGRWTLPILAELADHGRRYQDLHDALAGISYKVLPRPFGAPNATALSVAESIQL